MFYCGNVKGHKPEYNHSMNGECYHRSCKWKIVEYNRSIPALTISGGMEKYTPIFHEEIHEEIEEGIEKNKKRDRETEESRNPLLAYNKLRVKYLHFKDVLAGNPENTIYLNKSGKKSRKKK